MNSINLMHILILSSFAFILGSSQVLLKKAVNIAQGGSTEFSITFFLNLLSTLEFWGAIFATGSLVFVWAWILSFISLSKAYPFVVLAFVFAAILESFFFEQELSKSFFVGCVLILAGLIVIVKGL